MTRLRSPSAALAAVLAEPTSGGATMSSGSAGPIPPAPVPN